jgi:peptidoglycan-associated lipoprotein
MKTLALVTALLVTALVGCQPAPQRPGTAAQPAPDAITGEPAPVVGIVSPPDRDALSVAPAPPPPQEFFPLARLADIHFDYDAYEIRPEDTAVLDDNAEWLRANPRTLVLIEGHTDERGTGEYNLGLGDRRAAAAMSYLLTRGIPAERMVAISYGEERPLCVERTEACWAQNRRAHFLIKPL